MKPTPKRAPDWNRQMRFDIEFAKRMLLDTGAVRPMFILHLPDAIKVIQTHWTSTEEKRTTQKLMALMAAADGAEAVVFIAEAWWRAVPQRPGETEAEHKARVEAVPPSEAEDRIEVVMIASSFRVDGHKQSKAVALEIIRGASGRPRTLREISEPGASVSGAVADLLTDEPLTEELRGVAQRAFDSYAAEVGFLTKVRVIHPAGHA